MRIGIAPAADTGLTDDERVELVREAGTLGYGSAWTNAAGPRAIDAFGLLERYWKAAHLAVGTNVVPTPLFDLADVGARATALSRLTGGRLILGVGTGPFSGARWRAEHGMADRKPLATMREHVTALRRTGVPVYLAAIGPEMLKVAGETADGALPNWMEPAHLAWARDRIAEGAHRAGRDPRSVQLAQFIRVAVDADPAIARHSLAKASLGYALARPESPDGGHYRANMTRMGLDAEISALERARAEGASDDALADLMPDTVLRRLGAWGTPDQAVAAASRLSEGLDEAIVRVVVSRPGIESARAVLRACAPARWS